MRLYEVAKVVLRASDHAVVQGGSREAPREAAREEEGDSTHNLHDDHVRVETTDKNLATPVFRISFVVYHYMAVRNTHSHLYL